MRAVTCFVALFSCMAMRAQEWDWVQRLPGDLSSVRSVALDNEKNVYIAGTFSGSNAIGTNIFISAGAADIFIAKLSPQGQILWATAAGGTNEDVINRLVVTSNGTVFVVGRFDLGSNLVSNSRLPAARALVARIDEGVFTWADSLPEQTNAMVPGIALGPDETPWVVGGNGHVFVRHYDREGAVLGTFAVGNTEFNPSAIAVNRSGEPYIIASFYDTVDLGTTNLTSSWSYQYFIAALNPTGGVRWAWVKPRLTSNFEPISDLKCVDDGGVVSTGFWDYGLPQGYVFVARHSASGALEWLSSRTGFWKSIYTAQSISVDARGNCHLVGYAFTARGEYRWNGIGVWAVSPDGAFVSEEFITCGFSGEVAGNGIAVTSSGDTVIVGHLQGRPRFGTNEFGPSTFTTNGFVARRATIVPPLDFRRVATNLVLKWPRPAARFLLQQATVLQSNAWSDVSTQPNVTCNGAEVTVSPAAAAAFFRLRRTNDIILVPPRLEQFGVSPGTQFPDGSWIVVTANPAATNLTITAWINDPTYQYQIWAWWFDASGTNRLAATEAVTELEWEDGEEDAIAVQQLKQPNLAFPVGTNTIVIVASDNEAVSTNTLTFTVVSVPTMIQRLIAEIDAATSGTEQAQLRAPLSAAFDAAQASDWNSVRSNLEQFRTELQSSTQLTGLQRYWFDRAAQETLAALPPVT